MQKFSVTAKDDGKRLDQFLVEKLKFSRKKVKQMVDHGQIYLGTKKIIIASWKLAKGDTIAICPEGAPLQRRERYLKVHYEDSDLLVVEKPPGVACEHTAQTLTSTIVDDINDYLRRAHPTLQYPYVGLMHRLDRETSGLMVYTISKQANALAEQFKRHTVGRRYLALVEGNLGKESGRIETTLVKDLSARGKKMKVLPVEQATRATRAITEYRVLERYGKATLVEARLLTGKTHQVRVHFASIGHPVLGDQLYGSKRVGLRHALHAAVLEFRHPVTHKKMLFRSKPPKDFQNLIDQFRREAAGLGKDKKRISKQRRQILK